MTILIAVSGSLGSGKSEVVQIIKNIHGPNSVCHLKLAQPLYDLQKMTQEYLNLEYHKDRLFLQTIGTEWGRKKYENMWVDLFLKNVEKYHRLYDVIICDDVRFLNEFYALKERGFITVKIDRPLEYRIQYEGSGDVNHSSETGISSLTREDFDFFIENNSTYDDFVYVVSEMFMDIKDSQYAAA